MTDRTVKVTLVAQVSGYVADLQKASAATQKTATAAEQAKTKLEAQQKVFDTAGKAALAFGAAAAAGVGLAVKTYADWEAKMAQVSSLSHASTADLQKLSDATFGFAQQYGASASEAAEAEIELVKGGASVSDMINGALSGALTLASAGQIDVAKSTQIAVSAMTQFGKTGRDIPHIADLLAAGADKALGSVEDLGMALNQSGLVANDFGISVEESVGTLSAFANAGLIGSDAGTSFKNMLTQLAGPSKQASDLMDELGIHTADANGKFIGVAGLAGVLQDKLKGLTDAQRQNALTTIFGTDAYRAASILYEQGADGIQKWTNAVDDNGFAAEQAAGKLNSLNGDLGKLKAAFENDLIQTGKASSGILRGLTQDATDMLEKWGALPQPVKDTALAIAAGAAAVGLLGGAAILAVPKLVAFNAALNTMGVNTAGAIGGLKTLAGGAGIVGLVATVGAGTSSLIDLAETATGAKMSLEELQDTVDKADTKKLTKSFDLDFTGNGLDVLTSHGYLSTLNQQTAGLLGTFGKFAPATKLLTGSFGDLSSKITDTDKALAKQVQSGDLDGAAKNYKALAAETDGSKDALKRLKDLFPQYEAALKSADTANKAAGDTSQDVAAQIQAEQDQIQALQQSSSQASQSVDDLVKALQDLDHGQIDASEAAVALQQAIDDASDAARDNGRNLDINTQKGRDNKRALDGIASSALSLLGAQEQAGASSDDLTKSTDEARKSFIAAAEAMGMAGPAASDLADKYGLIPGDVSTLVSASGVDTVQAQIDDLTAKIAILQAHSVIDIYTRTHVGTDPRSGIAQADGGVVDYYAAGGIRENHVAQIAPAGALRVWAERETGGEAYIPLAPSKRARSLSIWEETGHRLHAFADGGFHGYQAAPALAVAPSVSSSYQTHFHMQQTLDERTLAKAVRAEIAWMERTRR